MNLKLEKFKKNICGKHVILLGVGVSNKPLISQLISYGARVTCCDKNTDIEDEFLEERKLGAQFRLGEGYLDDLDCDCIFKTPGIRPDIPQLVKARKNGVEITSEMEMFFKLCPCKIIAVTGSDGKTTTTTLIYKILTGNGNMCHLGGNIGKPLFSEIETIGENDYAVIELSSFQLMSMRQSPDIAVVTNVAPNHLDFHTSMDEYIKAKKNIFKYQNKNGLLILNEKNDITRSFADEAKGGVVFFGGNADVHIEDNTILFNDKPVISKDDICLPGEHNVENYMAAIAAVGRMVEPDVIKQVANTFGGVEHRIEYVREVDGVKFYNDSIASSPTRARAGLYSFNRKVILIAGGYDKHIPFDDFGKDIKERVKRLYLIGATAPLIKEAVVKAYEGKRTLPIITQYTTLETVVKEVYMAAEAGDIVLFSPACASFDMFKNFEERGRKFKEIVKRL